MSICTHLVCCAAHFPFVIISAEDPQQVPGVCVEGCAGVKGCPAGAKGYDAPGYLYHKSELEEVYARSAENAVFL